MLKAGMFAHRLAVPSDMPALQRLMTAAIRDLLPQFLAPEKVEASFAVMGGGAARVSARAGPVDLRERRTPRAWASGGAS